EGADRLAGHLALILLGDLRAVEAEAEVLPAVDYVEDGDAPDERAQVVDREVGPRRQRVATALRAPQRVEGEQVGTVRNEGSVGHVHRRPDGRLLITPGRLRRGKRAQSLPGEHGRLTRNAALS